MIKAIFFFLIIAALLLLMAPFVMGEEVERCGVWKEKVEGWLEEEGVEKEYFALAVAESRCKPEVISNKGAKGFWQMTPSTMRTYGCNDATNVECQTRAAAKYIRHLEQMCGGDRECVIKSYNMGGHNYRRHGATKEANGLWKAYKEFSTIDKPQRRIDEKMGNSQDD